MTSAFDIARLALLGGGLVFKAAHLVRRPHDWSLRVVVLSFALLVASTAIGTTGLGTQVLGGRIPLLVTLEYALLMCGCFCIMLLFAERRTARSPRLLVRRRLPVLVLAVVVTLVVGALAPAATDMGSFVDPWVAVAALVPEIYVAVVLARAARDCAGLAGSPEVGRTHVAGLVVATAGLVVIGVSSLYLAGLQAATLAAGRLMGSSGTVGLDLALVGGPLFVVGICYPGLVTRCRAFRLWLRRLREFRRLGPLWRALADIFPEPGFCCAPTGSMALLRVERAHRRRWVESRDGLVRLSPYVSPDVDGEPADQVRPLARWVVAHTGPRGVGSSDRPVRPLLVPASGTAADDMDLMIALSDAVDEERRRRRP